jgi:ribosome-associated translation inhibitor RaiA
MALDPEIEKRLNDIENWQKQHGQILGLLLKHLTPEQREAIEAQVEIDRSLLGPPRSI